MLITGATKFPEESQKVHIGYETIMVEIFQTSTCAAEFPQEDQEINI